MAILEAILVGLSGYIVGIFLLGVTACCLNFWISIELAIQGDHVSENLWTAARQLWGVAFTIGIIYAVNKVQGPFNATAFAIGYLWHLLVMIKNMLSAG